MALDLPRITAAAVRLLDEHGLAALSTRKLAAELGVRSATLYWHVRDKDELLDLVAEAICAEAFDIDDTLPWRDQLATGLRQFRTLLRTHRDAAQLLRLRPPRGPHRLGHIETTTRILLTAGFTPTDTAAISVLLADHVLASAAEDDRRAGAAPRAELIGSPTGLTGPATEPTGPPANPTATHAGQSGSPADPPTAPADPPTASAEQSASPADSTGPAAEPSGPPADPTAAPAERNASPAGPTGPAAEPTGPPAGLAASTAGPTGLPADFPHLRRVAPAYRDLTGEALFELGVEVLLDGLAAKLAKTSSA
ncbi:TetR/AcrR family transcriptional regulator C-terminal domain-containing protein [Crossiella cryophila]|uniref:AcrR family transcriptional regulator n=1 Tax=Crossiella cryophila TaxID=43355 RepID=A0A7W7CAL3_9PSEU|nr:TetR/AcrR family transcriptional regulator C-terminal domain-containing protein [Crossiella cryophila]MBB4677565.1 AcrR family transcriptional regulator [Crossiella cryophila]